MKNIYKYLAIAISAATLASCNLHEKYESGVSHDEFYNNESQCIAGLNGCYIPFQSIHTHLYMIATECCTDLLYSNGSAQDSQLDISPATPRFGATMWTQAYQGVRNCNAVLNGIENAPISEEKKAPLLAEGKIIRAYYYYLLTCFFGDVPFYEDYIASVEDLERISKLPRMSAVETRNTLIAELKECVPHCQQARTSDVEGNRCGAALGWMLIGKFALWNKLWDDVIFAVEKLEGIYGDLTIDRYPIEDIKFCNKNTPESIFEIQHTYTPGGLSVTSSVACYFIPKQHSIGGKIVYGTTSKYVEIDYLGSSATQWAVALPTSIVNGGLFTETSRDLRKDLMLVWKWPDENGIPKDINSAGVPWMGPKWWCPGMIKTYDSNNYKIFRYADALLMKAEAYCMLNDNTNAAAYLNKTKARANASLFTRTTVSQDRMLTEIKNERARELMGEFQRKYDLVRWGTWYDDLMTYAGGAGATNVNQARPCMEYYPIPATEVAYSGGALDNKAYEEDK